MGASEKRDVLDLLYEGGDESALSAEEQGELAKWRELRGVMRELPEAEPRDGVAQLLAAAREHDGAKAPRGLWGRLRGWFAVMAAHPAMSAAATVVVVAGVAGAFYMSGRVGSDSAKRAPTTTVSTGALSPTVPEPPAPAPAAGSAAGSAAAAPEEIALDQETKEEEKAEAAKLAAVEAHHPAASHHEDREKQGKDEGAPHGGTRENTTDYLGTGGKPINGLADGDVGGEDQKRLAEDTGKDDRAPGGPPAVGRTAPTSTPAPATPPPPPPAPATVPATDETVVVTDTPKVPAPAPAQAGHVSGAGGSSGSSASAGDAAALTRQAIAAAKKKDCKTVDALASRVFQLDEGYYRSSFATDPDVRDNCPGATRK